MIENIELENVDMEIIANAGAAKGKAFEALDAAKNKDFDLADNYLKEAEESLHLAHSSHFDLLQMGTNKSLEFLDILTTHSQDHFMAAMLAIDLIREMVEMYKIFYSY